MDLNRIRRREMLQWLALGGVCLGESLEAWAEKQSRGVAAYPPDKVIRQLARDGWVVEYKKADVKREGIGLRAPSVIAPESYDLTPAILETQFKARGLCTVLMPSFAHLCNQTCLVTKVEVHADDKLLRPNRDYLLKPVVTQPMGNRFWQVSGLAPKKLIPIRIRVTGIVSNAAAPASLEAAKTKIAEVAAEDNRFEKRYRVAPVSHWLKKPSRTLKEAAADIRGTEKKKRFATYLRILEEAHKKCKLQGKGMNRDPENFIKDGMKGSCGANADFVNFTATTAGYPYLYYTEGFVVVPKLNYMGLHAWNMACCNGWFIADSLHADQYFPEYSGYFATSVGPNVGHPGGTHGTTNGGYTKRTDTIMDYYIYFSTPGYAKFGPELRKMKIPEEVQLLGDFVAEQRKRVNKR
jgi:hypothetical protein